MPIDRLDFTEINDLFATAESAIKKAEIIDGELVIPAINELRYAGNHMGRALNAANPADYKEEIARAERHCKRAIFDCSDVLMMYYMESIKAFRRTYANITVTDIIPDYTSLCAKQDEMIDFVSETRHIIETTPKGDTSDIPNKKDENFDKAFENAAILREIYKKMDIAREELNKKIEAQNQKKLDTSKNIRVAIFLALFAAIIQVFSAEIHDISIRFMQSI